MTFQPDYPWAIVFPAHPNNYYHASKHGDIPNQPRGFVLHTPEEPNSDGYPGTPNWFANDLLSLYGYRATTHYFVEDVPDQNHVGYCKVYQCVPEKDAAVANGVLGKPYPPWAVTSNSLNWQTLSVEIEGYAHSIHIEMSQMQLKTVAHLISHRAAYYGWKPDREHVIGHYQVANNRTDPGGFFPWDRLISAIEYEEGNTLMAAIITNPYTGHNHGFLRFPEPDPVRFRDYTDRKLFAMVYNTQRGALIPNDWPQTVSKQEWDRLTGKA